MPYVYLIYNGDAGGCSEVYREPAFKGTSFELSEYEDFSKAKELGETSFMLL
ncbi:MAG: hypothetical protein HN474_07470 [Nitrospina sp.]|nr:hypothetical protein [Nitrospina sp.]